MCWSSDFISVKLSQGSKPQTDSLPNDLREAFYWLNNAAGVGDAIFMTSSHPQYKGTGFPTYLCHKHFANIIEFHEKQWTDIFLNNRPNTELSFLKLKCVEGKKSETNIIEFPVKNEDLKIASNILIKNSKSLEILLSNKNFLHCWNSEVTSNKNEVYVISVNPGSDRPVTMKIDNKSDSQVRLSVKAQTSY